MNNEFLKIESENIIEENPSKFMELAKKFNNAIKNPETIVNLLQGIGAVPAATATIGSIVSGNIPNTILSGLVLIGTILGSKVQSNNKEESEAMGLAWKGWSMLRKNSLLTLSDGRDYFVVDEIILDEVPYYYLATTDGEKIDVLYVRSISTNNEKTIYIVKDDNLLRRLTQLLISKN